MYHVDATGWSTQISNDRAACAVDWHCWTAHPLSHLPHVGNVLMLGLQRWSTSPQPLQDRQQQIEKEEKQIRFWVVCPTCRRHRQEAGECVKPAVDVIGRCNGPCLCPPSWTGARLSVPMSGLPGYCFIRLQVQGGVHPSPCRAGA